MSAMARPVEIPAAPAVPTTPAAQSSMASGRASALPSAAYTLAAWAANNLRNWIAESDRTLAEHDAARHNEDLARNQLKAHLIAAMADADHPVVVGDKAFWVGHDGEVTSGPIDRRTTSDVAEEF